MKYENDVLKAFSCLFLIYACLVALFVVTGCTTPIKIYGEDHTIRIESGSKLNNAMSASIYSRGGVQDSSAAEGSTEEEAENVTNSEGGGEFDATANTDVGQGDDTQTIEAP